MRSCCGRHPLSDLLVCCCQPYLRGGQALFERGQAAEAEKAFKTASTIDPTFGAPHYALGQLYESQDKKREALRQYKLAVAKQKDLVDAADAAKRLESQVPPETPASAPGTAASSR